MSEFLNLPYYNNTSYPLAVKEQLGKLVYSSDEAERLKYYQFITKEFFTKNRTARGMLIGYSMGLGKTRLAVSIANYYRKNDKRRKVIVLLSKSLEGNFRNAVREYTKQSDEYVDKNYKFVSLNASNMFKQVTNVDKTQDEAAYEKKLGNFLDDIRRDNSLNNSLLIVDEAHNLFNSITNGAKNATALYDLIMESINLKLIFLTGTPIVNDPFELVPCFNMLRGYIAVDSQIKTNKSGKSGGAADDDIAEESTAEESTADDTTDDTADDNTADDTADDTADESLTASKSLQDLHPASHPASDSKSHSTQHYKSKKRFTNAVKNKYKNESLDRVTLFSESTEEFDDYFVDRVEKVIKNKDKFINRIWGLTSYYGDLYFTSSSSTSKEGFPKKLPTIVEKVPMSQGQYARYIIARNQEQEETKFGYKAKESRFSASKGGNSTYRVKSRQLSNYAIPEYALGPVRGAKAREKFVDKITIDDLQNTAEYSPKMGKILHNIGHHKDSPGMVYSQFVSGEGLAIFARILEARGYVNYRQKASDDNEYGIDVQPAKRFAILSGDIDPAERVELINQFNSVDNANGSIISLLLLSGAVAEGIDLKRIRHVHITEPFWNYARINQVETRAIRYLSHVDLPLDQQNVQTYIYLSDYPVGHPKIKIKEPTTDIDLYIKSIDNMKIINDFLLAVAESSMDCSLHYPNLSDDIKKTLSCKMCSPTNEQLFHPILSKDIHLPNACKPYSEKKITADEIIFEETGEKYYYKKIDLDVDIYMFNKKLNGFTPMPRDHPHYGALYSAIIEKSI